MRRLLAAIAATASLTACLPEVETIIDDEIDTPRVVTILKDTQAFVFTRDTANTTGAGAVVDLDKQEVVSDGLGQGSWFSSDVKLRTVGNRIYVIDRSQAVVSVLEPNTSLTPVLQFNVGEGTNPQDIAVIGSKGFVTRFDSTELAVVDVTTGTLTATVDLSEFADEVDNYPEMAAAVTAAGKVWVAVQRWERTPPPDWWNAPTVSNLVAVDPDTNEITERITLTGTNPQTIRIDPLTGNLLVKEDQGIEIINPTTAESEGWLLEGFTDYFAATTSQVYTISAEYDLEWNTTMHLSVTDRESGESVELAAEANYYSMFCLEISPLDIVVVCRGPHPEITDPGLRLFDAATSEELTIEPIATALPPSGITFFAEETTTVVR